MALVVHVKHSDDKAQGMNVPAAHHLDCGHVGSEKGNLTIWCACSNSAEAQTMQNALRQFHSDWPKPTVLMSTTLLTFKFFADNVELDDVIVELLGSLSHRTICQGPAVCNGPPGVDACTDIMDGWLAPGISGGRSLQWSDRRRAYAR